MYLVIYKLEEVEKPEVQPCSASLKLFFHIFLPLARKQIHQTFPSSLVKIILLQTELKLEQGKSFWSLLSTFLLQLDSVKKLPDPSVTRFNSKAHDRDRLINVTLFCLFWQTEMALNVQITKVHFVWAWFWILSSVLCRNVAAVQWEQSFVCTSCILCTL